MDTSYFTRAEFRAYANDPDDGSPRYTDDDIDRAQIEVIERLERWARSAWPTVSTATPPVAGDGAAESARSVTETHDGGGAVILLDRVPVISPLTTFEIDGAAVDADAYTLGDDQGVITLDSATKAGAGIITVTYNYGAVVTPQAIKRPAMRAAQSLLDSEGGRSRIPRNVREYRTEQTTFVMTDDRPRAPWPWDLDASEDVRTWWDPERPRYVAFV